MLKEIFDHITQFSLSKKNVVLKLFEAAEENYQDDAAVESFVFRNTRAPNECPTKDRNSSKYTIYANNNQKFGHSLRPPFSRKNITFDGFSSL